MEILEGAKTEAQAQLSNRPALESLLGSLAARLSGLGLAGQGVYATRLNGDIAGLAVPPGLKAELRDRVRDFSDRPYFRQASYFRHRFVSDVIGSIYNQHSTIFLCMPLGSKERFGGLLFAAAQPGAWKLPVDLRDEYAREKIEFVLVDSNGIVIVPPAPEMKPVPPLQKPDGESDDDNLGFPFPRIQEVSRRDRHVLHVVQNVVPVGWDDDVHDISPDFRLYSMVADVPLTRWKLALSRPVPSTLSKSA